MRHIKLSNDKKRFVARFPYNPHVVAYFKSIPKEYREYKDDEYGKRWEVVAVPETLDYIVDVANNFGFSFDDEVQEHVNFVDRNYKESVDRSKLTEANIDIANLGGTLLEFQKAGVAYVRDKKNVLIADEMGLGKTVIALAAIEYLNIYPTLCIVPKIVLRKWYRETQRWVPKRSVQMIDTSWSEDPVDVAINGGVVTKRGSWYYYRGRNIGQGKDAVEEFLLENPFIRDSIDTIINDRRYKTDIFIINYDMLSKYEEFLKSIEFNALIVDESHYIKNHKANRTKLVKKLAKDIDIKTLLSGTALKNRPRELIPQLEVLDVMDFFGGTWSFLNNYCANPENDTPFGRDFSGAQNLDELYEKLRAYCMVRRLKQDVFTELPDKRRSFVPIDLTDVARKEYELAEADILSVIDDATQDVSLETIYHHLAKINYLRQIVGRGKIENVVEWIRDFLESGEKLVVFGWHREVIRAVAEEFDAPLIDGSTSDDNRERINTDFQTREDCKLVVLQIQAGGVGINLTAASNVAFIELAWTPADLEQAEDRVWGRIDNLHGANIWYLMTENSIDTDMYEVIDAKRQVVHATLDGSQVGQHDVLREMVEKMKLRNDSKRGQSGLTLDK